MSSESTGHAGRAHALLSASSSYRWLACTPSARLEDQFKEDEEASVYAKEGTLAHEYAEVEIAYAADLIGLEERVTRLNRITENPLYSSDIEEYAGQYADYVLDAWKEAKAADPYAVLLLEDKIDLSPWIPEGFGSNDAIIIAAGVLKVFDLKFGKGVRVSAVDNPQLKLYSVGALDKYNFIYDVRRVEMVIHQPRVYNISTFEISADDLILWADSEVVPKAALAFEGEGDFVPGSHCHFCKVAVRCKALAKRNLELAKHDFEEPALLTDEDLLDIFDRTPALVKWANKVSDFVYKEAIAGRSWKGFKLVEGRSVRTITEEEKVKFKLLGEGFKREDFLTEKLKGITDLTKKLGKERFEALVGPYVVKPTGKPALVPEDDPRPVMNLNDFKDDFEDESGLG